MTKTSKTSTQKIAKAGTGKRGKTWKTYEEVAAYMLKQAGKSFGLSDVEGKQKIMGEHSGTPWEIDAKGVQESDGALVIIECRRRNSRSSQEEVAAVAYRIFDTGAAGGIIVSPHPLQSGAVKVAKASKIEHVQLDPDSTRDRWIAKIQGVMMFGLTGTASVSVTGTLGITVRNAAGNVIEQRLA